MKPRFFFDYIYFSVTRAYLQQDSKKGVLGVISVSLIQVLLVADIVVPITRLFYDRSVTAEYSKVIGYLGVFFYTVIAIINHRKYSGSYNKFRNYWKDESKDRKFLKGTLVVLLIILPWVPLILVGVYW